jgi:SNF2 family DNA or RNA helicase
VARDYLDPALDAESWNKLDYILRYMRDIKSRGERAIVFSGLRTMVAATVRHLRRNAIEVLPITAEVPAKKRFGLIREFTANNTIDCIVASLNCLNRGHTIVAANHVLIVDLEYSPEATEQAEDRVHRPGQTKDVFVKVLLSADTIDPIMWEVDTQKSDAIRHAIDGQARFADVAEILRNATGDVQMEIARRIDLLPVPSALTDGILAEVEIPQGRPAPLAIPAVPLFIPQFPSGRVVQLSLFDSLL